MAQAAIRISGFGVHLQCHGAIIQGGDQGRAMRHIASLENLAEGHRNMGLILLRLADDPIGHHGWGLCRLRSHGSQEQKACCGMTKNFRWNPDDPIRLMEHC